MMNFLRGSSAPRLSLADAIAMAAKGEITVIDVREAGELRASGMAKGAIHIPLSLVAMKANPKGPDFDKRIDPKKQVAVYCASGGRSGMAAQVLNGLGYEAVNLGGLATGCRPAAPSPNSNRAAAPVAGAPPVPARKRRSETAKGR